jgi:hypothetical protein
MVVLAGRVKPLSPITSTASPAEAEPHNGLICARGPDKGTAQQRDPAPHHVVGIFPDRTAIEGRDVFEYLTKTSARSDFSGVLGVLVPFSALRTRASRCRGRRVGVYRAW